MDVGGLGSQFGVRFQLVNALPAAVLSSFVAAVVAMGGFTDRPSVDSLTEWLDTLGVQEFVALTFIVLITSIAINSFQTPMVKFLEGYWRPTGPSVIVLDRSLRRHERRRLVLNVNKSSQWTPTRWQRFWINRIATDRRDSIAALYREWVEGKAAHYPRVPDDKEEDDEEEGQEQAADRLMPTRLGNILREAEDRAGKRFGLDAVSFAGHFLAVAKPDLVAHYEDSRAEMDVAVRFVFVWAACTVVAVAAFVNDGPWLCVALASYFLSWLSYRSALRAASSFGASLQLVIDLHRFDLVRALHGPMPTSLHQERQSWPLIIETLQDDPSDEALRLKYSHEAPASQR